MVRVIRVGLVGAGRQMDEYLVPALRQIPHIELSQICSLHGRNAGELAMRWEIARVADGWEAMLNASDRPKAIVVATSPQVHADVVALALERGVHVFVEKPPALDVASIKQLARHEVASPHVRVFVGYNFQFGVPFNQALEELRRITEPSHVAIRFLSAGPRAVGFFPSILERLVWDTLIHPLHMAFSILGSPRKIFVSAQYFDAPLVGIHVHILHKGGGQSTIVTGNHGHRFEMSVRVTGRSGTAFELDDLTRIRMYDLPDHILNSKEVVEFGWPIRRSNGRCTGYLPALESFFDCIRRDTPSLSPLAASVDTIATLQDVAVRIAVNGSRKMKVSD